MSTIKIASSIIGTIVIVCLGIGSAAFRVDASTLLPDAIALEASEPSLVEAQPDGGTDAAETTDREDQRRTPGEGASAATTDTEAPSTSQTQAAPSASAAAEAQSSKLSPPASTGSAQSGSSTTPESPRAAQSTPAHVCSWTPIAEQVWVVDRVAWDEPRYTTVEHTVCSICFLDLTEAKVDVIAHGKAHVLAGEGGGTHSEGVKVQTGTVHHEATGHYEQAITGYVCKGCGGCR